MKTLLTLLFLTTFNIANAGSGFFGYDNLLGPYPARGSLEEKQDIDQLLYLQSTRTREQCEEANREKKAGLEVFFGGKDMLSPSEVIFYNKKFRSLTAKTGVYIYLLKSKFKRARPYDNFKEIHPCIELESSKAYPSGHTTLARVYARVLGAAFPERAAIFLKRADQIAFNRVLGGVHHPSDIVAGKKLGDAIADDYLNTSDNFYNIQILNN